MTYASDWQFTQGLEVSSSIRLEQEGGSESIQSANLVLKEDGMNGHAQQTFSLSGAGEFALKQQGGNRNTQAVNSVSKRP